MSLREAIEARDLPRLRQLLRDGANPNQAIADGQLLTWAVGAAGLPFIRALIEAGADPLRSDAAGEDALERAVNVRRKNVIRLLAPRFTPERVADAEARLPYFRPSPGPATQKRVDPLKEHKRILERAKADPRIDKLVAAASSRNAGAVVQQLLEAGADPDAPALIQEHQMLVSPVWAAMYFAKSAEFLRLLANAGADLNEGFPHTPLCVAANWGTIELIRALIDGGAEINRPSSSHETPLFCAVHHGKAAIVAELVAMEADPNLIPKKKSYDVTTNYSPLEYAAMAGMREIFAILLPAAGSGARDLDATLLCTAAGQGDLEEVKKFVERRGIDVNVRDMDRTPLIEAAREARLAIMKYLLGRGADVNLPAGAKKDGESPLIAAALSGKVGAVQLLIEAGADIHYAPKHYAEGTALAYAKAERLKKVVEYLLQVQRERGHRTNSKTPRGVPTFDTNDATFLVSASVESVAGVWARQIDAGVWEKDVLGRKVKLTNRCYAVWKIVDQPWSIVMKLNCKQYAHWPGIRDAASLSKTIGTRALYVANSDTGGVSQYVMFDKGALVELFDDGTAPNDATLASVVSQFRTCYGLDLSGLPNLAVRKGKVFGSAERTLALGAIKNGLEYIDVYMKQQEAFVPFFVDEWGRPGQRVELTLEGFGPDDIERLDYVAVQ